MNPPSRRTPLFLIALACAIFVYLLVIVPSFSDLFIGALALVMIFKLWALLDGIGWLWNADARVRARLSAADAALDHPQHPEPNAGNNAAAEPTAEQCQAIVFSELERTAFGRYPCGVMDWRWLKTIDSYRTDKKTIRAFFLQFLRDTFYRFESLVVYAVLALIFRSYKQHLEDNLSPGDMLSIALSFMSSCLVIAMATEILVGHVMLDYGYSRYFHRKLVHRPRETSRTLLRELWHFSRLVALSLCFIASACQSYYATFGGFHGIATKGFGGATIATLWERLSLFAEFFSFVCTTFATVGYGDVFPDTIATRLIVSAIHLYTMAMVLVLLQVVVSGRSRDSLG